MRDTGQATYDALDLVPAQICILDRSGAIRFVNRRWIDFAQENGYAGDDFSRINYVNVCDCATGAEAETANAFARRLKRMLDGVDVENFSVVYPCHAPTQKRWFKGTASALPDGAVVTHTDITEEYRRLEAESRVLSAAGVIHDLRSPLNAVIGFADLSLDVLSEGEQPEVLVDSVKQIRQAGGRMLTLVNDLLDYAQELHSNDEAKERDVALHEILNEIISQVGPAARRKQVRMKQAAPVPFRLLCDEHAVWKMLLNIVTNAVKYNKPGGAVDVFIDLNAGGGVEICVQDGGVGIPQNQIARMFAPFTRAESARVRLPDEGTGIGLALVREIVVRHDGIVRVSSAPDVGTAITAVFPAWRTTV